MKKIYALIVGAIFPFSLKKRLLSLWLMTDQRFWLESKRKLYEPDFLTGKRFTSHALKKTFSIIKARFGKDATVYFMTDERKDLSDRFSMFHLMNTEPLKLLPPDHSKIIICAFESDERLLEVLKALKNIPNCFYYTPYQFLPTARYFHRNDKAKQVLVEELNMHRGKFDLPDFENIIQAIDLTSHLDGDYLEIGVFRGDSALVALKYMERNENSRNAYFIDVFEGFTNPSSQESKDAFWLDSHQDTSYQKVQQLLKKFPRARILKSDIISDELPDEIKKVSCCNIDVDQYDAVEAALRKVAPLIQTGGIIILEDQGHTPLLAGALLATHEFLQRDAAKDFIPIHMLSGQMFLIRIR